MMSHSPRWSAVGLCASAIAVTSLIVYSGCTLIGSRTSTEVATMHASIASGTISGSAPTATELDDALRRVGLDPETLAAAGITGGTDVADVVGNVADHLAATPGALASADTDYGNAMRTHDALERRVRSGLASTGELTSYENAVAMLASATTARSDVLDAVFAAGIADLTISQQGLLATIRTNRAEHGFDGGIALEFFAVSTRSESEWVRLRDALANERISTRLGESTDSGCEAFLTDERAVPAVSTASASLEANGAAVRTQWDAAIETST